MAAHRSADGFADLVDDLLGGQEENNGNDADTDASQLSVMDLVLADDVDGLAKLLGDKEVNINSRDPTSGRSLLHESCARGNSEIVKLLLQNTNADLMLRTMLGRCSALHIAVTNNFRPIVFLLLSHGADALSRDRFGCSPMHYVKSLSTAKLLIQYGGKVLDYNAKKKHVVNSVSMFAIACQKDHSTSAAEREASGLKHQALVKYLEKQAEAEYRVKLESIRVKKQQGKPAINQKKDRHGRKLAIKPSRP